MVSQRKIDNFLRMVNTLQKGLDKIEPKITYQYSKYLKQVLPNAYCFFNGKEFKVEPRYGYNHRIAVYYGFHHKEIVLSPTKLIQWIKKNQKAGGEYSS